MKLPVEFAKIVVECWKHHAPLYRALFMHYDFTPGGPDISTEQWQEWLEEAGIDKQARVEQPVTSWVATHFHNANTALWDGKFELAWKWMASGKDVPPIKRVTPRSEARKACLEELKDVMFVGGQRTDKRHDWKTVK